MLSGLTLRVALVRAAAELRAEQVEPVLFAGADDDHSRQGQQ